MQTMTSFEDLKIDIFYDSDFEFLIENINVANGYGVSIQALSNNKARHNDELLENKHFLFREVPTNGGNQRKLFWTKKGIVRLGFFIKSERAKKFRDWAEDLIISQFDSQTSQPIQQTQTSQNFQIPEIGNSIKQIIELKNYSNEMFELLEIFQKQSPINLFRFDKIMLEQFGTSPPETFKIDLENQFFLPTELGKMINKSPVEINLMLAHKGFQIRENGVWKMTSSGRDFGIEINGQFHQIKWSIKTII